MPGPILRVITTLEVGYASRHFIALAKALQAEYPAIVAAGRAPKTKNEVQDPDVVVKNVPLVRALDPLDDARALVGLRRLIAKERPWLVETHLAKAGTLGRLAALTSKPRPKTIHTFHRHALRDYFRAAPASAFLEIERRLAPRTDLLVALSDRTRDECLDLGIGELAQWRVVPLALEPDPPRVLRRDLGIPQDAFLAGTFISHEHPTDHVTLLEAVRLTPGLHLVVAGDGDSRPVLEEEVRSAGLEDRVHFSGWVADIPGSMGEADVVVLSSESLAASEEIVRAALAGCPVVAMAEGGAGIFALEGVTRIRVPARDPAALSLSLSQLRDDETGRREMDQAARPLATRAAVKKTADALRAVYEELGGADSA